MNTLRFLIFDLDGTLIDSSDGVVEAVNYSLRMTGQAERSAGDISRYIGFPLRHMYAEFGVGPFDQLYRHFQDCAAVSVIEASVSLPGANTVIEELHTAGFTMAIATTKIRRHVDQIVAKLGWADYFGALVGGDEVSLPKPDPAVFRLALSRLSAVPDQSLVIGDTINDVLAAQELSLPVVAVRSPYGGDDQLAASNPDYLIDTIAQLPVLLKEIQKRREAV